MSHFTGLVVLTPYYLKKHDLEESLSKYDENLEVPEYSSGEVTDFEKVEFIKYYKSKDGTISDTCMNDAYEVIYDRLYKNGKIDAVDKKHETIYLYLVDILGEDEVEKAYVDLFNERFPDLINTFEKVYNKNGEDYNENSWRINSASGKWERYTTYNPNSKLDWYEEGGRWENTIKTKDGEFVNSGLIKDIDWTDFKSEDYTGKTEKNIFGEEYRPLKDDVVWHYTKSLIVDGEWVERGKMGWFGISIDNKDEDKWSDEFFSIIDKLPECSEFHLIDFHI